MTTEQNYEAAAAWAENEMELKTNSTTARYGTAAARHGQEALERALGGRPSIDPVSERGHHSPKRQVRLPSDVDNALVALAAAQHRTLSAVMRDALADYVRTHTPANS